MRFHFGTDISICEPQDQETSNYLFWSICCKLHSFITVSSKWEPRRKFKQRVIWLIHLNSQPTACTSTCRVNREKHKELISAEIREARKSNWHISRTC